MNRRRMLLALAMPAVFAIVAPVLVRAHQEHDGVPEKLALDKGKKWPTDEPLRDGMNKIRALLAPNAAAIQSLKLSPAECKQLGAAVQRHVATISAQSKLPQDADVMVHVLVKNLLDGAEIMQGRGKVDPVDGAFKVLYTTNNYGKYFDHPGWKPLG
jgi:hypothetical protein